MISVNARATTGPRNPFQPLVIERRDLGAHDVLIDIAFAGICHSDIHTARNEWGEALFPLVPGHEIAGTIASVGASVTKFAVGDRAGVGCFVDSCRECENCRKGEEQHCLNKTIWTYNTRDKDGRPTYGGYSQQIVVDENYALRLPDSIGLDAAAPLMCAGITMYSPLRRYHTEPGKSVAILGMGGLGHMGVKIAHAMGAEVTVLSQSLSKQADGLRLGADHYFATGDSDTFDKLGRSFDVIVSTLSANVELGPYLDLLKLDGAFVNVGMPEHALEIPPGALVQRRAVVTGSLIGGIAETQEMLDFCAQHGLGSEVEVIGADQIDEAYDRVVNSDVRYRFVIDTATMSA